MKLKILAQKAARLPEIDFELGGGERWSDMNFKNEVKTLPEAICYIKILKERMSEQTDAIFELKTAYEAFKDILLEADVES